MSSTRSRWIARSLERLGAASPGTILTVAWLVSLVYAYPGQLTADTLRLVEESRAGVYHDDYSAVMAALWHLVEHVLGGQIGMLVLQQLSLLFGLFWVSRAWQPPRRAAWLTAAIWLFPPVLVPMAVVAKTSLAAGLLMLGAGALSRGRGGWQLMGLVATGFATAVWSTAAAAGLPLILGMYGWRGIRKWPARYAVAAVVWAAACGAGLLLSAVVASEPRESPDGAPHVAEPAPRSAASPPSLAPQGDVVSHLLFAPYDAVTPRHRSDERVVALYLRNRWSGTQRHLTAAAEALDAYLPLFAPWLYLVLLLVVAWSQRRQARILVLLASAALHGAAVLLTAPTPHFGFVQWTVIAVVTAAAHALASRWWAPEAEGLAGAGCAAAPAAAVAAPSADGARSGERSRCTQRALAWFTPTKILMLGWLALLTYAYPGYMSFDSVYQLLEARSGIFSDWHPPAMAAIWRVVDYVIAGPFGMLSLQSWTFLLGAYLIARRVMPPRAAALVASFVLLFPTVCCVMAVIWKDAQMCGFLLLGTGLLLQESRGVRILGLVSLGLASAMRHNALTMTLPIVVLLFVWSPRVRGWRRYVISVVAWLLMTMSARVASSSLTADHRDLWHDGLALYDITGTLNYIPNLDDAKVHALLEGVPLVATTDLMRRARLDSQHFFVSLWAATRKLIAIPRTEAQRAAVARAWRAVVVGHPFAFLQYRLGAAREILQLSGEAGFPIYIWFTDIGDPVGSSYRVRHQATAAKLQIELQQLMLRIWATPVVLVYVYAVLAILLVPFCVGHRLLSALVLSALSSESALLLLSPAPDTRYSMWLSLTAVLSLTMVIAQRLRARRAGATRAVPAAEV